MGPIRAKRSKLGPIEANWGNSGQTGNNAAKWDKTRPNGVKPGKMGQTGPTRAKLGQMGASRAKRGLTGLKGLNPKIGIKIYAPGPEILAKMSKNMQVRFRNLIFGTFCLISRELVHILFWQHLSWQKLSISEIFQPLLTQC